MRAYDLEVTRSLITTGSLKVVGDITAEQYQIKTTVTQVTMSAASGSMIFGDSIDDTHQITGSTTTSGSINVRNGELQVGGTIVPSGTAVSSSFAQKTAISGSHTSGFEFAGTVSGSSVSTGSFGRVEVAGDVTVADGSAAAPAYSFTGDTDTGMYRPGANGLNLVTAGGVAMHINSAQKVGIGTTSVGAYLDVSYGGTGTTHAIKIGADDGATSRTDTTTKYGQMGLAHYTNAEEQHGIFYANSTSTTATLFIGGAGGGQNAFETVKINTGTDHASTTTTERLRVDSTGDTHTNDGSVSSLSDVRVKKNIEDLTDGLNIVNQLRPRTYQYNGKATMSPDDGVTRYGFVADEVLTVAPQYVVTGSEKLGDEGIGEDGEMKNGTVVDDFKSMSTGRLIPMLVNAIQELSAEVNTLQAQISGSSDFSTLKSSVTGT